MVTVNAGYALAQLERALEAAATHADPAARARARERVEQWRGVIEGMAAGELAIGSRTPTGAPAWATLEVVHGGFATGRLAAEGAPLAHERALAERLGVDPGDRRAMALHYVSDAGREELRALLASGRYRVDVPEEGALLAVAALIARGAAEPAAEILDAIAPYLDRLRFHPRPSPRAFAPVSTVHAATIGKIREQIAAIETPLDVRRMNESIAVWAPLTDRAVDLVVETVRDGAPCSVFPAGWHDRAAALLADHAAARATHRLCARPHHPKQNLAILVRALAALRAPGAALPPRLLGLVRVAIEGHQRKHGAARSALRREQRAAQARVASLPTRRESAEALAARLVPFPAEGSLESLEGVGGPIAEGEHAGAPLWPSVARRLQRCLDASVEELVERGVLTSGEAIARVLPQISSHVRAMGFRDPELARLHAAVDAAFRRRRSLLLLNYESQVKLAELPWVAALEAFRVDDGASRDGARRLFSSVAALAIESFPQAIVPNPLLGELRELARRAELDVPIVDELAADIFMGGFTAKFVRAAAIAARRLEGTLYARYYAMPVAEVHAIAASLPRPAAPGEPPGPADPKASHPVPAFGELCERLAACGPGRGWSVASNGCVIEQQQILTTQNLVPLIDAAGLDPAPFPALARRAFDWLVRRVQVNAPRRIDHLRTAKNAAYAWRQAIAFLSLAPPGSIDEFLAHARQRLAAQPERFRARFARILDGLERAHAGHTPRVRLLGWTAGEHPLL